MPSYIVEAYAAGSGSELNEARDRARRAAELGAGIRYVRTTFLPGDEVAFHLFEAPSASVLDAAAGRRAALQFERIVEAVEGAADPTKEEER